MKERQTAKRQKQRLMIHLDIIRLIMIFLLVSPKKQKNKIENNNEYDLITFIACKCALNYIRVHANVLLLRHRQRRWQHAFTAAEHWNVAKSVGSFAELFLFVCLALSLVWLFIHFNGGMWTCTCARRLPTVPAIAKTRDSEQARERARATGRKSSQIHLGKWFMQTHLYA